MRIAFLGGGNMASALIGGLLKKGVAASSISVVELSPAATLALGAVEALASHGLDGTRRMAAAQVGGEAATISEGGGRFVSFIGQSAWFHNPRDLWPDAVDIATVARFARAIADLTISLANSL